jgi:hypothetical protein
MKVTPLQGEPFTFEVESRSTDAPHKVDLLGRKGFGECSCKWSQTGVAKAIKEGGKWSNPATTCAHVKAARLYNEFHLYTELAKRNPKDKGI